MRAKPLLLPMLALTAGCAATSAEPRSEDPLAIIDAIRSGLGIVHEVEPDRANAIALAIREANAGDVILIAGKGHETYQEIAGKRHPFSDAVAAALTEVVSDPERAAEMGKAGRVRAMEAFSWESIAERTVEVYRSVL